MEKTQDEARQQQTCSQQPLFGHPGFTHRDVQALLQLSQPSPLGVTAQDTPNPCPANPAQQSDTSTAWTILLLQRICPEKPRASCGFLPSKLHDKGKIQTLVTILLMLITGNKSQEEQLFWYSKSIQLNKFA